MRTLKIAIAALVLSACTSFNDLAWILSVPPDGGTDASPAAGVLDSGAAMCGRIGDPCCQDRDNRLFCGVGICHLGECIQIDMRPAPPDILPDLIPPPDMSTPPDLRPIPDLAPLAPDMSCPFGAACTLPHASGICNAGGCVIAQCDANRGDCNRVAADGCEANFKDDDNNCGACGKACTFVCVSGACNPF